MLVFGWDRSLGMRCGGSLDRIFHGSLNRRCAGCLDWICECSLDVRCGSSLDISLFTGRNRYRTSILPGRVYKGTGGKFGATWPL
jgi:hypothetical protein